MANKRREMNHRESKRAAEHPNGGRGGMEQREETHREPKYRGEGRDGEESRSSGSYAHKGERVGPGPVPGAGEMYAREDAGDGQEGRAAMPEARYPSRKTPPPEKNVTNRTRGQEEED